MYAKDARFAAGMYSLHMTHIDAIELCACRLLSQFCCVPLKMLLPAMGSKDDAAHSAVGTAATFTLGLDVHPKQEMGPMLTFTDPCLEKEFMASLWASWIKNDAFIFFMGGLTASLFWNTNKLGLVASPTLGMAVACFAVLLVVTMIYPYQYQTWRAQGLSRLKPSLHIIFGMLAGQINVSHAWQPDSLLGFMLRRGALTALPPLILKTLGCPLSFKHHVVGLLLFSSSFFGWISSLCNACDANDAFRLTVHNVGWMTDKLMARISLLGFPANIEFPSIGEYPCWQVGLFYAVLMEILFPALVTYAQEYRHRILFLKAKANKGQEAKCNGLKGKNIVIAAMYLLVYLQVLWFALRAISGLHIPEKCV